MAVVGRPGGEQTVLKLSRSTIDGTRMRRDVIFPLDRRRLHTSPALVVKRYERRYGPAAGVDLSESAKKDGEHKDKDALRQKEKIKTDELKPTKPPFGELGQDSSKQKQSGNDEMTSDEMNDGDHLTNIAKKKNKSDKDGDPLETMFKIPEPTAAATDSSAEPCKPPERTQGNDWSEDEASSDEYIHHFDTYGLVKELQKGGFTEEQSIYIMKGIRGALGDNLKSAKNELMSKSQIENDSYLFKAASEELRNNIMVARASEIESQRTRRAQLQHELDILTQRLNQDFSGLKDDLKEMFNNQKISTREAQRSIDTAIQELNYQITVSLNSDGKSEVEGLRWILTRRAALAIGISAFMSIIALRYHSYKNAQREKKKEKAKLYVEAAETAVKTDTADAPEVVFSEPIG
ncbi:hypothetical protein KEM54_001511 [Ascosphaera aggregata]|nr:hypothetical protein KEM54_001511 [Ascosphaera aggregata]